MIIHKSYTLDSIWCSIFAHQLFKFNNHSNGYNMHCINLLNHLDGYINTISTTKQKLVSGWNHHCLFLTFRMYYMLLRLFAPLQKDWYSFPGWQHQHNTYGFGRYNWTIQQLWTTLPIFPDASRCFWIGWMQCNVLSYALRHLHWYHSKFQKMESTIEVYPEECIVVYNILQSQNVRMCKFQSY